MTFIGAADRDRTGTDFTPRDFKSLVSACSTTAAYLYSFQVRGPVAVPEKIIGLTLILDFFDRCHSFPSLLPPPAALGSLPPCVCLFHHSGITHANILPYF